MEKKDFLSKCANCGKRAGVHRASDNACPIGIKTVLSVTSTTGMTYRAGYKAFSLRSKFKARR